MSLTLEVIGEKTTRMGRSARKTFTGEGTIGRLPDNDWVSLDTYISDPLSRWRLFHHDTSRNGVFINSQENRLPRGKPHPLRSGGTIFIDDYEVRVVVEHEPADLESKVCDA